MLPPWGHQILHHVLCSERPSLLVNICGVITARCQHPLWNKLAIPSERSVLRSSVASSGPRRKDFLTIYGRNKLILSSIWCFNGSVSSVFNSRELYCLNWNIGVCALWETVRFVLLYIRFPARGVRSRTQNCKWILLSTNLVTPLFSQCYFDRLLADLLY
jgi:hypothetical protein